MCSFSIIFNLSQREIPFCKFTCFFTKKQVPHNMTLALFYSYGHSYRSTWMAPLRCTSPLCPLPMK